MNTLRNVTIGSIALLSAAAGAIGMSTIGTANAASSTPTASVVATAADTSGTSTTTGSSTLAPPSGQNGGAPRGPHQANGITETPLTGDTATKVQDAVMAANPGATVERLETDAEGAAYEAHITKADGSVVTVKLDASFAITETVNGHG